MITLAPPESTVFSIRQCDLQGLGSYEASGAEEELRATLPESVEMNIDRVVYHPAFALTHSRHIDSETVDHDAELLTPAHVRGDLRTVDNVLAGQARDVVT